MSSRTKDAETTAAANMRALMSDLIGTLASAGTPAAAPAQPQRRRSVESVGRMSDYELKALLLLHADSLSADELETAEREYVRRCAVQRADDGTNR